MNLGCRFDWYESTHDAMDDGRAPRHLALALGGRVERGKGRNGYATCEMVLRGDDELARVYGHSSREGEIHIVTTSESCDEVVPIIREMWPEHRVSRADAAVDFSADFAELDERAVNFAKEHGISYRLVTDSAGGATRYLGAPTSEVRARVYKKSEQLRALHPERAAEIPDGVVRVEGQMRPGKRETKEQAARMTADELWGLGQWSQRFAADLLGIDAPRVATHHRRPSEWARMLHFLERQYRPGIERRAEAVGLEATRTEILNALGLS